MTEQEINENGSHPFAPERLDPPWRPSNPAHKRDGKEAELLFGASLIGVPAIVIAAHFANSREGLGLAWFVGCVAAGLSFWSTARLKRSIEDSPIFMTYGIMLVFSGFLSFMYGVALAFLVISRLLEWLR